MAEFAHSAVRPYNPIPMLSRMKSTSVEQFPDDLSPGILYVSERFRIASHSCACGCGSKVITPLGKLDWKYKEGAGGPTLHPSIGNWNLPCRSHYWIRNGQIIPALRWSDDQIQHAATKERAFRERVSAEKLTIRVRLRGLVESLLRFLRIR
jgi:hypothetical protein